MVTHLGVVRKGKDNILNVSITDETSCSSCQVKSACGMADDKQKVISLDANRYIFEEGTQVEVTYKSNQAFRAVFLGYLLPFMLVIFCLLLSVSHFQEKYAGLISIGVLLPYFFSLKLFNKKIKSRFQYTIKPV